MHQNKNNQSIANNTVNDRQHFPFDDLQVIMDKPPDTHLQMHICKDFIFLQVFIFVLLAALVELVLDCDKLSFHVQQKTVRNRCLFWEVYTPPRIAPLIRQQGYKSMRSVDYKQNWDLSDPSIQHCFFQDLFTLRPFFTMLSPPCTCFGPMLGL